MTNPLEWYDPIVYKMCAYREKIRKDGYRNINCCLHLLRISRDFYLYFMDFHFTKSMNYFYNQKISISSLHFEKGEIISYILVLMLDTRSFWKFLSWGYRLGALDKEINFHRTIFKCDPRKKMVDFYLKATNVNGNIFS